MMSLMKNRRINLYKATKSTKGVTLVENLVAIVLLTGILFPSLWLFMKLSSSLDIEKSIILERYFYSHRNELISSKLKKLRIDGEEYEVKRVFEKKIIRLELKRGDIVYLSKTVIR